METLSNRHLAIGGSVDVTLSDRHLAIGWSVDVRFLDSCDCIGHVFATCAQFVLCHQNAVLVLFCWIWVRY